MKTGLSKYIVKLPNKVINIPLNNGTLGIFFSKNHTNAKATIVATIKGGIAIFKFLSLSPAFGTALAEFVSSFYADSCRRFSKISIF